MASSGEQPASAVPAVTEPVYDCLILSGGGSKGAYGAGVAKAIESYRTLRNLTNPICYVGASAGALNAYLLASGDPDDLIGFWLSATNESVLGVRNPDARTRRLWLLATAIFGAGSPRSLYDSKALKALIRDRADLGRVKSPLLIAATDYTQGRPKAFYVSELIDKFVDEDKKEPKHRRRLAHLHRIEDNEMLVKALLASAAIPVFFPPVEIEIVVDGKTETNLFIDGGVGNNTPTREAAYFFRFLKELNLGVAGTAFCVKQEQPSTLADGTGDLVFTTVLKRTLDVYHYVHTRPIIAGWRRINHEVRELRKKMDEMAAWLDELSIDPATRQQISARIEADFGAPGGSTARVDAPLPVIEPSIELGDTLRFDPTRTRAEISHGYSDALKMLKNFDDPKRNGQKAIDEAEYDELTIARIIPTGTAT
jgi:predicted acylesterase/phospholipase RssA